MTNAQLLQMARDNLTRFTAAPAPAEALRKAIEAHDIVFALYPDSSSARGFDTYLIKGKPLVPGASQEDLARLPTTAVPCADLEEAIALERAFGDGGRGQH
ncbi:hypothetical protein ASD45_08140 [Pseudolabrys sp. Root1462]|uniref:hypothetical protein n=1 Tax=Pseudolabrys sp. Root1462 TaxID=1736466 RepID=UPI000703899F|nr:hypothetical protein [Pseudolabrys sp. Root1462]KQZ00828.1 hypothetical protein ASD45_08140 [Pseudolabrys sp. Root1462]